MAKYDVWFSFGVSLELDDPDDLIDIARKARPELIDRIATDGIADCIEYIVENEDGEGD